MVENSRYGNRFAWLLLFVIIIGQILLFPIKSVEANNQFTIQIDRKTLVVPHNTTLIKDGRIFVPIRFVAEELNADVEWNATENKVIIRKNNQVIVLKIGSNTYYMNQEKRSLDSAPIIAQKRTLVPLRLVSEALGNHVRWNPTNKVVSISTVEMNSQHTVVSRSKEIVPQETYYLAKIIHAEARGESLKGQIAVGAVILNRVHSKQFPNKIYDVIVEKWGPYYQFEAVQNGSFFRLEPDANAITAAKRALAGEDPTRGALFFHNPTTSKNSYMVAKTVSVRIGKHDFLY